MTRRLPGLIFLGCLSVSAGASPGRPAAADPPNVILIMADDFGWGDLKCQGHPLGRTPAIDRMAKEGTRFLQAYSTGVTCCPSRTGFMTGKFPATFKSYPAGAGFGGRVTVTELLKKHGYRTGHFGKWHIGPDPVAGTYGLDAVPSGGGAADEPRPRLDPRGRDATIFDRAIRFVEESKDGPFYLNVWGHITHLPVSPPQGLVDEFKDVVVKESDLPEGVRAKFETVRKLGGSPEDGLRRYLAEVLSLDRNVERLLKRLDELGLREKTVVVFTSDQGPGAPAAGGKDGKELAHFSMMGSTGPFRGGKHGMYEGGVRVPFIVRWPGRVPAGRVDATSVLSGADWLPSVCRLAGVEIAAADFDGEDRSEAWLGKESDRTKPLFWKVASVRGEIVLRDGRWKLHRPTRKKGEVELYDVAADPGEARNLAAEHPDVVRSLEAKMEAWNATLPTEYVNSGKDD